LRSTELKLFAEEIFLNCAKNVGRFLAEINAPNAKN
jgi:hypothetical protein